MIETPAADQTAPISNQQRIHSIDTLRGVAVLGILLMNIISFGLPIGAYMSPVVDGATEGINLIAYMIADTFFEGSMRSIFSMLFGASVILFTTRRNKGHIPLADLYFRRTILLIIFGCINAYLLLWIGDILYAYGMAGLFLYIFRNSAPIKLLSYGVVILLIMAAWHSVERAELMKLRTEVLAIETISQSSWTEEQQASIDAWEKVREDNYESQAINVEDVAIRKSGYLTTLVGFAPINLYWQTTYFYLALFWDVISMMFIGMALMKWKVFDASRSNSFYTTMVVIGLGVGLPVNYYEVAVFVNSGFATLLNVGNIRPSYDVGRLFTSIGYIGMVMLMCKTEIFKRLNKALAAVGQMALSNYLSHTIICNTLFMGFGFGLVGELERYQIYYVVLAIWLFQLITSPLWLKYYRFGPVEWLWRSITYGKKQPMRIN